MLLINVAQIYIINVDKQINNYLRETFNITQFIKKWYEEKEEVRRHVKKNRCYIEKIS